MNQVSELIHAQWLYYETTKRRKNRTYWEV